MFVWKHFGWQPNPGIDVTRYHKPPRRLKLYLGRTRPNCEHHPLTPLVLITIVEWGVGLGIVISTKPMYTPPTGQPTGITLDPCWIRIWWEYVTWQWSEINKLCPNPSSALSQCSPPSLSFESRSLSIVGGCPCQLLGLRSVKMSRILWGIV